MFFILIIKYKELNNYNNKHLLKKFFNSLFL